MAFDPRATLAEAGLAGQIENTTIFKNVGTWLRTARLTPRCDVLLPTVYEVDTIVELSGQAHARYRLLYGLPSIAEGDAISELSMLHRSPRSYSLTPVAGAAQIRLDVLPGSGAYRTVGPGVKMSRSLPCSNDSTNPK